MKEYKEYIKLRLLIKTLDSDNVKLAIELSKGLGLYKQIFHDIQCLLNVSSLITYLLIKDVNNDPNKWMLVGKYESKYDDIIDQMYNIDPRLKLYYYRQVVKRMI